MRRAARAIIIRGNKILLMHRNKFGNEYYTLIGGGVHIGETPEQALVREVREETGMRVTNARLVFVEDGGSLYGIQHIYLCEVEGDAEPKLAEDTEEAQINKLGQNLYTPLWVPLDDFANLTFRSPLLQQAIMLGVTHGFPDQAISLDAKFLERVQSNVANLKNL